MAHLGPLQIITLQMPCLPHHDRRNLLKLIQCKCVLHWVVSVKGLFTVAGEQLIQKTSLRDEHCFCCKLGNVYGAWELIYKRCVENSLYLRSATAFKNSSICHTCGSCEIQMLAKGRQANLSLHRFREDKTNLWRNELEAIPVTLGKESGRAWPMPSQRGWDQIFNELTYLPEQITRQITIQAVT